MDFLFVPSDPVCFGKLSHFDYQTGRWRRVRALRSNRCVIGRGSRDENHGVRFRQSAENRSRAKNTHTIRGVSWKKIWKKKSSLWVYTSLSTHLSHTTETSRLSRIKSERSIFIKKSVRSFIEVRKLCLIVSAYVCICMWIYNIFIVFFKFSRCCIHIFLNTGTCTMKYSMSSTLQFLRTLREV